MSFEIIRNDITRVEADAIVNTANPKPVYASGTDHAIYMAAGAEDLLRERRKIGDIAPGDAVETPAFRLKAKYIIHTVGPSWVDGNHGEFDILRNCYLNSLILALKLGCESIAFPLIATGVYGFPKDKALQVAMSVIESFAMKSGMKIILVVFDKDSFKLSGNIADNIREYVDANYVESVENREYGMPSPHGNRYDSAYRRRRNLCDAERQFDIDGSLENDEADVHCADFPDEEKAPVCSDISEPDPVRLSNVKFGRFTLSEPAMPKEAPASGNLGKAIGRELAGCGKTFQEKLFEIIDERGLTGPQVYKDYISKQVYSKIQADRDYHPNKYTAIALCLSLHLNYEETQDLIGRAGWTLSPSSRADLVVKACILNKQYNVVRINCFLFDNDCPVLEKIK